MWNPFVPKRSVDVVFDEMERDLQAMDVYDRRRMRPVRDLLTAMMETRAVTTNNASSYWGWALSIYAFRQMPRPTAGPLDDDE